jgi:hypothetical protein
MSTARRRARAGESGAKAGASRGSKEGHEIAWIAWPPLRPRPRRRSPRPDRPRPGLRRVPPRRLLPALARRVPRPPWPCWSPADPTSRPPTAAATAPSSWGWSRRAGRLPGRGWRRRGCASSRWRGNSAPRSSAPITAGARRHRGPASCWRPAGRAARARLPVILHDPASPGLATARRFAAVPSRLSRRHRGGASVAG